ncbi:MAG: hypothetical protein KGJ62_15475 [Armatimonadetes bacterium]|nr:hypothetical protein [Armatimonadota bacterium]
MRYLEVVRLVKECVRFGRSALIQGPSGVGKTAAVKQAAEESGSNLIVSHPRIEHIVDANGMPVVAATGARVVPFAETAEVLSAPVSPATIWFWDHFSHAAPSVQAAHSSWLWGRTVNGRTLPDSVIIVAAGPHPEDGAGACAIPSGVYSKFGVVARLEPNAEDFLMWADASGIWTRIMGFVGSNPSYLMQPPQRDTTTATPRAWENLSKIYDTNPAVTDFEALALDMLGPAIGREFWTYVTDDNINRAVVRAVQGADLSASIDPADILPRLIRALSEENSETLCAFTLKHWDCAPDAAMAFAAKVENAQYSRGAVAAELLSKTATIRARTTTWQCRSVTGMEDGIDLDEILGTV